MTKTTKQLQCGWEDDCPEQNCRKCPRVDKITINLTHAEATCIEDFAVVDLKWWVNEDRKDLSLAQKVMFDLMKKVFKELVKHETEAEKELRKALEDK